MNKLDREVIYEIRKLRIGGLSIKQIESELGVSRATVSKYCRGLRSNNKNSTAYCRKASECAKSKWKKKAEDISKKAKEDWSDLNDDIKKMVAFYWAEGTKRVAKGNTRSFEITNSDPGIIKYCLDSVHKIGDYEITVNISIYPEQDGNLCADMWEKFLGIRPVVYIKRWRSKKEKLYSKYGVCKLYVHKSFELWHSVMTWIECWREDLGIKDSCQL